MARHSFHFGFICSRGLTLVSGLAPILLARVTKEFLLKHLAQSGFLPGHGFPTDVVPFVVLSPTELRVRDRTFRDDEGGTRTRGLASA
jgi:hypothetical protein